MRLESDGPHAGETVRSPEGMTLFISELVGCPAAQERKGLVTGVQHELPELAETRARSPVNQAFWVLSPVGGRTS
jgi:hypothetical protein